MSTPRPTKPGKVNISSREAFTAMVGKYKVPNSVGAYLLACNPPIGTIRTFTNALADQNELTTDLMKPLHIETLPDNVRISARIAIRRLRAECSMLTKANLDRRMDSENKNTQVGEKKNSWGQTSEKQRLS